MTDPLPLPALPAMARVVPRLDAREAAEVLEASFLAEMLKSAGLGTQANSMSGGVGEDQFASFHRQALAEAMVRKGGIGLAESFYKAMISQAEDGDER